MYDILKRQSEEILKHIQGELVQRQVKARTLVRTGSPAETIVEVGEKEGVDMIVIGSHGRHGAKRFFLGSVSSRVASHANVSVVLVK
jgi:nucleotide-binding universal stress UspA family protein